MSSFQFILQPYKGPRTRHTCPSCDKKLKFTRYINAATGEEIADHVGRCDRENSCGYHFKPKQYFDANPSLQKTGSFEWKPPPHTLKISTPIEYLPVAAFEKSISQNERCNLFLFFEKLFRASNAKNLCDNYFVGSDEFDNTVFWQVDVKLRIRQAKVMQYDPSTGRRNKEKGAFFAGKRLLRNNEANLQQCFFGEHLLIFPENLSKPVAIVESEKTAIIASVYHPKFIWIATGGIYGCKWTEMEVCKVLSGRNVVLFPDLGAFDKWKEKGNLLARIAKCRVLVNDLLEKSANIVDRKAGLDIGDYLLRLTDSTGLAMTDGPYPIIFDL